jgi:ribosome maturation factor RimP
MSPAGERLWELLESHLRAEGIELDDLVVRDQGRSRLVRVVVDGEGGVGVDRIADLSRSLSRLLDQEDPVPGSYTLEVTSPGLERALRRPEHYRKSVGREVVVKTREDVAGARSHRGILEAFDGAVLSLSVDGAARALPLDLVSEARTVFRWDKAPKPGRK